jgi:hypothetical protein
MSVYKDLKKFVVEATIQLLSGVTKAPVRTDGVDPQNILPLNEPRNPAGLKSPSDDYVFFLIRFTDSQINRQLDITDNGATDPTLLTRTTKHIRNVEILWQCYGDDAFEWAEQIRIRLFDPTIKELFAVQGISLITDVPEPVFIPEVINNQWYHRNDIRAEFNQLVTFQTSIPALRIAEVIIESEKGVEATCSVSQA